MSKSLKDFVVERLEATGQNAFSAARKVGLSRTFIDDIVRERKRTVGGDAMQQLAEALQVSPEELAAVTAPTAAVRTEGFTLAAVPPPSRLAMPKDLPVSGTAAGSIIHDKFEGFVFENGTIDYVRRPPSLLGVQGAFAIIVTGDSMWPMHPAGELRFINPSRPPRIGDSVIVETRTHHDDPGQAYIKILVRRMSDRIILEQFNPGATIEIPMKFVRNIYRIMTMNELFGM